MPDPLDLNDIDFNSEDAGIVYTDDLDAVEQSIISATKYDQFDLIKIIGLSNLDIVRRQIRLERMVESLMANDAITQAVTTAEAAITAAQTTLNNDIATAGTWVSSNALGADDVAAVTGLGTTAASAIAASDSALQAAVPGAFPAPTPEPVPESTEPPTS